MTHPPLAVGTMHIPVKIVLALAASPFLILPSLAQAETNPWVLKKYDANQNGVLDPDELARQEADKKAEAAAEAKAPPPPPPTKLIPSLVTSDEKGRLVPKPAPVDPSLRNADPGEDWREGYRSRVDRILRTSLTQPFWHNTYFENEKYSLGQAVARVMAGDHGNPLKLSEPDANARGHSFTGTVSPEGAYTFENR